MKAYSFNNEWEFSLEAPENSHLFSADTCKFTSVDLPHDWSIEFPFSQENGEMCTAFLPGGFAWYRKMFKTTEKMRDKLVHLYFDGIYNNATIYCNGEYIQMHPYGYTPFYFDLTEYLNPEGEENLIAVSVDRTRYADSRWYTGSGIYRDVELRIANKLHIPMWGVVLQTSKIAQTECIINVKTKIDNVDIVDYNTNIIITIYDTNGKIIASSMKEAVLFAGIKYEIDTDISLTSIKKWSTDNPNLYTCKIELICDGKTCDSYTDKFGIRSIEFDSNEGFFLNEVPTLIKGVCLHQELGIVGSAVPDDVWKERLSTLKECGCNAIRTAHNPFSSAFLDLCDEMGFLVQIEFFDEWDNPKDKRNNGTEQTVDYITRGYAEHFGEWAKRDLQNTVKRDINHPSIFQWSIGNEIEWTFPKYNDATGYFGADTNGNYFWTQPPYSVERIRKNISQLPEEEHEVWKTAKKLSSWVKELDTTRPVIANCIFPSVSYESGYAESLDMVGYSYRQVMYDYGHTNYPDKPIMGTENLSQWHEWRHVMEKKYIPGVFLWAGIDYLGEVGHDGQWPMKGLPYGLLDFTGYPRHSYYMFKSLWQCEPVMHIATNTLDRSIYKIGDNGNLCEVEEGAWKTRLWKWHDMNSHWNYRSGEEVVVEIYSNCDSITLYSNDADLGTVNLFDCEDRIFKWNFSYRPGTLKAVGEINGCFIDVEIVTTSDVSNMTIESNKSVLKKYNNEVAHVTVQLQDSDGNYVMWSEKEIFFDIQGDCKFLGVDNGDVCNVQGYRQKEVMTYQGRCLLLLQGTKPGRVVVRAQADNGIKSNVEIRVE